MHDRLLNLLACPSCHGDMHLVDGAGHRTGERVMAGELRCADCERFYPIVNGVPRLNPPGHDEDDQHREIGAHFGVEFTALSKQNLDIDPPELLEYIFFSRTGIDPDLYTRMPGDPYRTEVATGPSAYRPDPSFLQGKRVLDAGCGPGRLTTVAAFHATHVVGLDIGPHVDRAMAHCEHLDNVDIVQGSVLQPPFRSGSFDFAYSIGVIHHTPGPRQACHELARTLAPNGALAVWVYPPEYWGGPLRRPLARALHRVLSRMEPERSFAVCRRVLYPIGRLQMSLARRRWTKLATAPLFVLNIPRHPRRAVMITTIYDYYCPPVISTHTYGEVRSWLSEAGFTNLRQLPVPTAWLAENRTPEPA